MQAATITQATTLAVTIQDLNKSFNQGEVLALNQVSLEFAGGMLHGIIGPAGAGKTTLLRLILQLLQPDSGSIRYLRDNQPIAYSQVSADIAYMPEQQSLYADLSIREHLEFFASMYSIDATTYQQKTVELLEMTRLDRFLDRPAGQLSGGMYKKLGLMCALLRSPRMILLDEPTNGVDPISRREFWNILNQAVQQQITVIMTTAYMDEAERCEQVHLMEEGVVIGTGEPTQLLEAAQVENFDLYFVQRAQHQPHRPQNAKRPDSYE